MAAETLRGVARLNQLDVVGRRVFVRCDFDVPLSPDGALLDDAKLRIVLPTLRHLVGQGSKVIVATDLGPAESAASPAAEAALASTLHDLLGCPTGVLGAAFERTIPLLASGVVGVFPNLRGVDGEASEDRERALELAQIVDVYVNDAFTACHRRTMSLVTLPQLLPARGLGAGAGTELTGLARLIDGPERRFTALIGGGSVSSKAPLLRAMLPHLDAVLLGGVVANTFLAARGFAVGGSRVDVASLALAAALDRDLQAAGVQVVLPTDVVVADVHDPSGTVRTVPAQVVGLGESIVDLGTATVLDYRQQLVSSHSVLWSGLLGVCDRDQTREGTWRLAKFAIESSKYSAALGVSTTEAVRYLNLERYYDFVSRGGELAVAFVSGAGLPALEALRHA